MSVNFLSNNGILKTKNKATEKPGHACILVCKYN